MIFVSLLLFSCISYTQSLLPQDSINFKHEFEALLKKYKLDNKGYQISVQSNNQSGGQTAFIITNNYYKDPNLIPDSLNYAYSITIEKGRKIISLYPKQGSWVQPMLFYDTADKQSISSKIFPLPGSFTSSKGTVQIGKILLAIQGTILANACSKAQPLHVYMSDSANEFYYFGDNADTNKRFLYSKGKIFWIPLK